MARLIYSMLTSLDGYTEDERGDFSWSVPDEEVHAALNTLASSVGTYLYGRKMYETMVYWETAHTLPDQHAVALEFAQHWRSTDKIVFSRTFAEPQSARTRVEREFEPEAIRLLKRESERDLAVAGPELATQAIRAGLVDELQLIVCPVIVGGGKRFFPDGAHLDLELLEERRFSSGVLIARYAILAR